MALGEKGALPNRRTRSCQAARLRRRTARALLLKRAAVQAVVLAGGLATRMRPRTLTVPKSMLEVAGRPVRRLAARAARALAGFADVVMCVAHLGEQIRAHVGDGAPSASASARRTKGRRSSARPAPSAPRSQLLAPTFLVTYGDSYLPFDYAEPLRVLDAARRLRRRHERLREPRRAGTRRTSSRRDRRVGRPLRKGHARTPASRHIDYGAIALRREIIAELPAGEPRGLDAIQRELAQQKRLRAWWLVTGSSKSARPKGFRARLDRRTRSERDP